MAHSHNTPSAFGRGRPAADEGKDGDEDEDEDEDEGGGRGNTETLQLLEQPTIIPEELQPTRLHIKSASCFLRKSPAATGPRSDKMEGDLVVKCEGSRWQYRVWVKVVEYPLAFLGLTPSAGAVASSLQ